MAGLIDLDAELAAGAEAPKNDAHGAIRSNRKESLDKALEESRAKKAIPPKVVSLMRRAVKTLDAEGPAPAARLALKALDLAPDAALANNVMALCLERLGRLSKALEFYERAWKLDPNNPDIYQNLGMLAWKMNMLEAAEKFVRLFITMAPGHSFGPINLAGILRDQGRFSDAIELLRAEVYKTPEDPDLWNSLGTVLLESGDPDQAATFYSEALRLDEGFARAHHNLAYTLEMRGDLDGALSHFQKALENPPTQDDRITMEHGLSLATLAAGQLEEGWKRYAIRLDPAYKAGTIFQIKAGALWDGTDPSQLKGKTVLMIGEQGLGDEVMFGQIISDVIEAVGPEGEVRLAVEHRLVDLMARSFPAAKVARHYTINRENRDFRFAPDLDKDNQLDLWFPMGTAGRAFRTRLGDFRKAPFLAADETEVEAFRTQLAALGPAPKIGLLWKSLKMDTRRSKFFSAFDAWKPVFQVPGVDFVNLQYGSVEDELKLARQRFGVTVHQPEGIDLKDELGKVAALGKACDLVIGPMNATTNLTGAAGGTIWLLHSQRRYWAMMGSEESPWYQNTRSFGGLGRFGGWDETMAEVAEALAGFAAASKAA